MTFMKNILKNLCHKNKRPGIADEVLMTGRKQDYYEALLYGEGLLKTVFKAVKAAAGGQGYLSPKDLGLTSEQAREKTRDELAALPAVAAKLGEADDQARRYGAALRERYRLTELRAFAVVAIGLERVIWRAV